MNIKSSRTKEKTSEREEERERELGQQTQWKNANITHKFHFILIFTTARGSDSVPRPPLLHCHTTPVQTWAPIGPGQRVHVSHLDHLLNNQAKGNKNQEKVVTKWAGQAQRESGEREGKWEIGERRGMGGNGGREGGGSCCVRLGTKAEKMPIYELACCRTHGNHIFWSYLWTIKPESLCACQWVVSWHLFRLFLSRVQHAACGCFPTG